MTPQQARIFLFLERALLGVLLTLGVIGGAVFGFAVSEIAAGSNLGMLANYRPSTPTRLYDRNGIVFAELYRHKQELIAYSDIPPHVVQAFLAVEDDNFFNHFGLDFLGIFRAAIKNVLAGDIVQGGSTLTQQVAKQIYLEHDGRRERSFRQKVRETMLALQIEEELSKEEILEVYFNVIYLGQGCRGLVCAARVYFQKKPQDLALPEAAVLARLPKSPVQYSPFRNPRAAMQQHKLTLRRMANSGSLPADQVERMHREFWAQYWPRVIVRSPSQTVWSSRLDLAPYFTDHVRQLLEAAPEVGPTRLYTKGLQVYTTLDLKHQEAAEAELFRKLKEANRYSSRFTSNLGTGGVDDSLFEIFGTLGYVLPIGYMKSKGLTDRELVRRQIKNQFADAAELLTLLTGASNQGGAVEEFRKDTRTFFSDLQIQGAFLNIEPRTGYITSMIGGGDFSPTNQFNRALRARRQPGSAFKIFVYGAALEQRVIDTQSALNDAPMFTIAPDGSAWEPVNYGEGFMGLVPAASALARSLNVCAVQVFYSVGPEPIIDLASRLMKITNPNRFTPDPALALGSSEITPFELVTAASIIANDGKDVIPFAVRYVRDQAGNTIYNQEEQIRRVLAVKMREKQIQVIEPGLAYILREMLKGTTNFGTTSYAVRNEAGFHGELATKSGTTSGWSDAWVVGFNPEYASVVWFGFDKKLTMGSSGSGSPMAGPVIGGFYRRIYDGRASPRYADRADGGVRPAGVTTGKCGGLALDPKIIHGRMRRVNWPDCPTEEGRMRDMRDLIMDQNKVKPEELGRKGRPDFKPERLQR